MSEPIRYETSTDARTPGAPRVPGASARTAEAVGRRHHTVAVVGEGGHAAFRRAYHVWSIAHAASVTALVVLGQLEVVTRPALLAQAAWSVISLMVLIVVARRRHPHGTGAWLPNLLTGSRAVAAVGLLVATALGAFETVGPTATQRWMVVSALALIELTDFFDGRLARGARAGSSRATPFGATWDMECDALFTVGLTLFVRHLFGLGPFVVAIGLMRYVYVLVWQYSGAPRSAPKAYTWFAKTIAAAIAVTLITVIAPPIGPTLRTVSLITVLALQTVSFLWDLVLQKRDSPAFVGRG